MVSDQKRSKYISDSTSDDDMDYSPSNRNKPARKPTRTPKCFTKNALMARENRLKKKIYIADLEAQVASLKNDNKKLSAIVENQSFMVKELKREVKYLKSVINNSEDIGKLIQSINSSSGLSGLTLTSSLNQRINTMEECPKNTMTQQTSHPWKEKDGAYVNYPTPESTASYYSNPEFDQLNSDQLLLDLELPLEMNNDELLNIIDEKTLETPFLPVEEHNYHYPVKNEPSLADTAENNDVGVCLHVSKHKVSLEFCPTCSENAIQGWK